MLQRKGTGIFLPYFQGQRLIDFPKALTDILDKNNVHYYDGVYQTANVAYYLQPVPEDILSTVHSKEMINVVKRSGHFEAALYSAGGTVQAAEEIYRGNIDNAFVFTGFGDHHAGREFFGGMCYFNGAALAITALRRKGARKFAIVDTDSHHADGTRDIFNHDKEVMHICFCYQDYRDKNSNTDIAIPYHTNNESFLQKFRQNFAHSVDNFKPEMIFWEFGYDATKGEYGDKGLTKDCHLEIARIIKASADSVCHGRLVTILCGGSSRHLATYIIPKIIALMAELK